MLYTNITEPDASTSSASIVRLRSYMLDSEHSLTFFVGAGASLAGNTGMPSTPSLLYHLLLQAASSSGKPEIQGDALRATLQNISPHIGFEMTLNDFWQICREATSLIYKAFADLETKCTPNRVHAFLAEWLTQGGTVITTNYDCLIEREWTRGNGIIQARYQEEGTASFGNWKNDLDQGGRLFKIHGSLDNPESCLGALEHVGTRLSGHRAELLAEIVRTRPLCFVGWQGIDPDIPALLNEEWKNRETTLPTFWIHYEGQTAGSVSLKSAIEGCSPLIQSYAGNQPILTEADRAFGELLRWMGKSAVPNPARSTEAFDFSEAISRCTKTGLTRMVGITLRRAGKFDEAALVLKVALALAETGGERSAALQETSLLQQQLTGRDTDQARRSLERASRALQDRSDIHLQLNADFGILSMSIVALKNRPWLILKIPWLFHRYQQHIETLQRGTTDKESVALHRSLFNLYLGRLRYKLFGWLGIVIRPLGNWILRPFDIARAAIEDAKDIHLHSRVDVLAYRAVALAYLGRCKEAHVDIPEIDRLAKVLKDEARAKHWKKQADEIARHCLGDSPKA